jgi:demethylmenaquinone methyltransferase / 2-methoxy-6-polyprenyl-1,4-benzoquinol methylase
MQGVRTKKSIVSDQANSGSLPFPWGSWGWKMERGVPVPEGKQIQRMFTGIAGKYDLLNHVLSMGTDYYWWYCMSRASGAGQGKLFLDVAAGTGDSSVALARRGAAVVSTDFTFAMLAQGPPKFRRKALETLIWASTGADAQALPFHSATFDGLTICYGIRNVEHRARAWAEFLRVLKPGGRLTVLEFSHPRWGWLRGLYGWYSRIVLPRLGGWISGDPGAYAYLPESIRSFPDQEVLARELEKAGFEKVAWKNLTGGIAALHLGCKPVPESSL